ncbi:MAG: histidine--tRNA ligase [Caldisphaeraceae archaeon]|nr:histidine--tRNA ligase [Caldisphaeraceae archaeon]MEB3691622.1 histidine--tRNA ligase [Caldisphaeraceae archaeon]MEB3798011.1 histidine--tRNA ligase [Caldisphaeraceae archaeon]
MVKTYRPPRGFRDLTPEMMILRKKIFSEIEKVFRKYGFDPIETPTIEYWETLSGKYGEEAESRLIWRFKDPWSNKEYALRYDLTVPLVRFISTHPEIQLPFKRYQIGPVWRHDEPQKGRYREFYQCDADIIGSPYPEADAEMINLLTDSLKSIGWNSGFVVRLNDRRLLFGIFESELKINPVVNVYRIIDKLDKIGLKKVEEELNKEIKNEEIIKEILHLISLKGTPEELLELLLRKYKKNKYVKEASEYLKEVMDLVKENDKVVLDLSLVRGLDYYTGPIYEVVLEKPKIGSVSGGGRYDDLAKMFSGRNLPATGVSIGVERLIDAGIEIGLYNIKEKTYTQVQVIFMEYTNFKYAWNIAMKLREAGINTRIELNRTKEETQRRKANRMQIPILIFVGKEEEAQNIVTVYSTTSNKRIRVKVDDVQKAVNDLLGID